MHTQDIKIGVISDVWVIMAPFDRGRTIPVIPPVFPSCTVSAIQRDIGRNSSISIVIFNQQTW